MAEGKGNNPAAGRPAAGAAERTTAPAGDTDTSRPAAAVPDAQESDSAKAARELREAAEDAPMFEGLRQDLLQSGTASDPMTGKVYTVDDLSADDREAYRRSHEGRSNR